MLYVKLATIFAKAEQWPNAVKERDDREETRSQDRVN